MLQELFYLHAITGLLTGMTVLDNNPLLHHTQNMPNQKTNDGKKALHIQMVETMPQDSIPAKGKLLLLLLLCFDFQFLIENFDRHGSSLI